MSQCPDCHHYACSGHCAGCETCRNAQLHDLTGRAFRAAMRRDDKVASALVSRIDTELGAQAVHAALTAWADTTIHALGLDYGKPKHLHWQHADTGKRDDASAVPPPARWAGQLLNARVALDEDTWAALIDALPDDAQQVGLHVMTFLSSCAATAQFALAVQS